MATWIQAQGDAPRAVWVRALATRTADDGPAWNGKMAALQKLESTYFTARGALVEQGLAALRERVQQTAP